MEMSITRALAELKLSDKKINQRTSVLTAGAVIRCNEDEGDFIAKSKAAIHSIEDMIKRRNTIKREIVLSNAKTTVTIGGESMTVAEAIERKTSIELNKNLSRQIRETYFQAKRQVETHNARVEGEASKVAEQILGNDSDADKGDAYTAICKAHTDKHSAKLLAYDRIEDSIDKMQDKIDDFECEVDFILTESNTRTIIEI